VVNVLAHELTQAASIGAQLEQGAAKHAILPVGREDDPAVGEGRGLLGRRRGCDAARDGCHYDQSSHSRRHRFQYALHLFENV
jgi:hypothetical protein